MRYQNVILLVVLGSVLLLSGCGESRARSAHRRYDRLMEQARLEAALESIQQGRLAYAKRLLEKLIESDSAFAPQARAILKELQFASQQVAIARHGVPAGDSTVVN